MIECRIKLNKAIMYSFRRSIAWRECDLRHSAANMFLTKYSFEGKMSKIEHITFINHKTRFIRKLSYTFQQI